MSTTGFSLPNNLSYSQPVSEVNGKKNFVQFSPVAGTSFSPGDTIKITINSSNQFLDPTRSYLKFTLKYSGTHDASHVSTYLGNAACINRVDTTVGGVLVESITNYNAYLAAIYSRMPAGYQNVLKKLEGYSDTTGAVITANALTYGKINTHALRTALFEQPKAIPLAFIRGGIVLDLFLEAYSNMLTTNATAKITGYTITNVSFVACMVTPPDAYLASFQNSLESGNECSIPLQTIKSVRSVPTNASAATEIYNIGFITSLQEHLQLSRSNAGGGSGNDFFNTFTTNNLSKYNYNIGGSRYPQNFQITQNSDQSVEAVSYENVMSELVSIDNTYAHLNTPSGASSGSILFYDFSTNKSFGSGVPVADGIVTIEKASNGGSVSTSVYQDNFFLVDSMLKIGQDNLTVNSVVLA